jgi:hypothetical protein
MEYALFFFKNLFEIKLFVYLKIIFLKLKFLKILKLLNIISSHILVPL